jgi:hypothetical protein
MPPSFLGSVHSAAATENFFALEHHSVGDPWWATLVTDIDRPIVHDVFVTVPETPRLGVELNDEAGRLRRSHPLCIDEVVEQSVPVPVAVPVAVAVFRSRFPGASNNSSAAW